ncbi:unnamed protein product [Oppiella nova]|uniref:Cytosolic endo-beta-N-acetylglucosaminidase TIM barrel domain-containing protein n=1 Tax=Oppiella nova TaxID=334625 RepID=A0A7R9LFS7_9ACAR|nr:unnamed protein product [Oppiella nova]CAG2163116.1 unnamed protein product [Oppiella nova]
MKGGYIDDSGSTNESAYSHHFITIPPIAWINASHKNGVSILGTVIVEGWTQSKLICSQILSNREVIQKMVRKLVDIAKYYHFEGWLINIECQVERNCIENLIYFVELLTQSMHSYDPKSLVIWYDSVISPDGDLKWQNELNSYNKCFFDVCDGIFLNYTWNETNLKTSYDISCHTFRNFDVFVGIDVFGRNCFGGGGLNTNLAVKEVAKHDLSLAIFASAWTHEVLGATDFTANEYLFWSLLDLGVHHFPQTLPLCTSFCQGFGLKQYKRGQIYSQYKWHNLSIQELQPTNHTSVEICTDEAFNGGGCLRLKQQSAPLFECEITVKKCFYGITYKSKHNHNKEELEKFKKFGIFETSNGWLTQAFIIESLRPDSVITLTGIQLNVCHQIKDTVPDVLIGQLVPGATSMARDLSDRVNLGFPGCTLSSAKSQILFVNLRDW